MARNRKSSKTDKEVVKPVAERLKPPFPVKPGQGKYVLYCDTKKQDEDTPRVFIPIFAEAYAARRILNVLIGTDTFEECEPVGSRSGIITSGGVRITAFHDQIKELLAFEPTAAQDEWRNEHLEQSAMRLRFGTQWEAKRVETVTEQVEDEATGEVVTREVRVKKAKKEAKEARPKVDRTGMVTASDLAARLKIEPRIFRGALRALKKIKPEGGWLWTKDEAEAVFKEVTAQLKKDSKKGKK